MGGLGPGSLGPHPISSPGDAEFTDDWCNKYG
jgi:hypothetical protein